MPRPIVLWLRLAKKILVALAFAAPGLLSAAQCGLEPVPQNPIGTAFQRGCDQRYAGHYAEAVESFQEAARQADAVSDLHWKAKSLVLMAGVQEFQFHYAASLETAEKAIAVARLPGVREGREIAASAEINTAMLYAELGNFSVAKKKQNQAIADLAGSPRMDILASAYFSLSFLQFRLGELNAGIKSSDQSLKIAARAPNSGALQARVWDSLGTAQLLAGKTSDAEVSLDKAVALYQAQPKHRIAPVTLEHLAELKWRQGQNEAALSYINQAFANADTLFKFTPQYYPLSVEAGILRDLGRPDDALNAYRKAIHSANLWRRGALPGDANLIETVRELHNTYQPFVELAAEQSLAHHNEALAREALEALAQNRAAGIREQRVLEMDRNRALPAEYLELLGEFQAVQARVTLDDDAKSQERLNELEVQLAEVETKLGISSQINGRAQENNLSRTSLRDIQTALGNREALLSFCLAEQNSFLWAVTDDSMTLYKLPPAKEIGAQAKNLRDALEHRGAFATPAKNLSQDLFSQLDAKIWEKPNWRIVGDGALLDRVPFSVLPVSGAGGKQQLLGEHSIRLLPAELPALSRSTQATDSRFVGIADPLYNLADSRRPQLLNASISRGSNALGRLPGSQREIRSAAKHSGMENISVLTGVDATVQKVKTALEQRPAIVHFAVHVVSPPGHPEQAALALSLGEKNIPELLTREEIASLRVPGSLIVLSGCSSGQGQQAPGVGLIGLSRAWLLAGAEAVVVSNWPTPDDSGPFFTFFYSELSEIHTGSVAQRAALALQKAQLKMQRQGGYGSSAGFWAAYSIVSKE